VVTSSELQLKITLAKAALAQDAATAAKQVQQALTGIDADINLEADPKQVEALQNAIGELADETLETARQAKFLKDAYNLSDKEVEQVIRKMNALERSTKSAKDEAKGFGKVFEGVIQGIGQQLTQLAFQAFGRAIDAIKQGIASTIRSFVDLEAAIKQVGVISDSTGTPEFAALTDEIERLGIVTSKTPQEIANTAVALSRAGFAAEATKVAMEGIARASEASGESLEVVGDIIAKTVRAFNLEASESQFVANALVATANTTNTTINSLGEAFSYVAATAATANQPVDDILVLLGLLGDAGIQGGQAGTNLAAALDRLKIASAGGETEFSNLVRGSKRATEAFDAIGAEVRNADGQMKSILEILPVVQDNLAGLSQQDQDVLMKALFGVEGGRAFQTLLNAAPERIAAVTDQVTNLAQQGEGAAVRAGEEMLGGLSGALQLISGSIGTLVTQFGASFAPALEGIVRLFTDVINNLIQTEEFFAPLTESAERFNLVLGNSPEIAAQLTETFTAIASETVEQLGLILDALTAFISEEGNVEQFADQIESLTIAITAIGQVVRFFIALADGVGQFTSKAESLPIIGDNIDRFLKFPTPLTLMVEAFLAWGEVLGELKNIVVDAVSSMLDSVGRLLPVLNPLIDRVQQVLSAIGRKPEQQTPIADAVKADVEAATKEAEDAKLPAPKVEEPTPVPAPKVEEPDPPNLQPVLDAYAGLTRGLEIEQANRRQALVEGGADYSEIEAQEREHFERRIAEAQKQLDKLYNLNAAQFSAEDQAKLQQEIDQLETQLANDRLALAEDVRKGKEDAEEAATKAAEEAAEAQTKAAAEAAEAAEEAHKQRLEQIEAEGDAQEALAQAAVDSAEVQLQAIDRVIEAYDRQAQQIASQLNLLDAVGQLQNDVADARQSQLEEVLADEEASDSQKRKAAKEIIQLGEARFEREKEQLEQRQALELRQFDLAQKAAEVADARAIREQELAIAGLEIQRLEIENERTLAQLRGDTASVEISDRQLGLLDEQVAAQQDVIASLQEQAALSRELAADQRDALLGTFAEQGIDLANSQLGEAQTLNTDLDGISRNTDRRAGRLLDEAQGNLQLETRQADNLVATLLRSLETATPINASPLAIAPNSLGVASPNLSTQNQDLLQQFQQLNSNIQQLATSPRSLNVTTPDPVADTSKILRDIAEQSLQEVNP
jgi:TP901 family phage tail tape measure protein